MTHDSLATQGRTTTDARPIAHGGKYGERAAANAAEATRRTRELHARAAACHPSLAPIGSGLVLALGIWTWVAIPVLDLPYTNTAWNASLRYEGVAVLVTLAGVRLCLSPGGKVAASIALLCGLASVAFGLWLPHTVERGMVVAILTGAALVVAAVIAMAPPSSKAP